jgi:hypothetical protein
VAKIILKAVQMGSLAPEDAKIIRKTALQRFTLEDYSSFDNMRIDPLARSLLLERLEKIE